MIRKTMIPIQKDDVAPRFDLAVEVLLATVSKHGVESKKMLVLSAPSAEELCQMALREQVDVLVCGAIEQEYYDYLTWKEVRVLDSIIGSYESVLVKLVEGQLAIGDVFPNL